MTQKADHELMGPEPEATRHRHPWKLEIRAVFDDTSITVYQAYSPSIATAAVEAQRLSASPNFRLERMTWIKPSWAWMLYRSFYSFKDPRQSRILAIRMSRDGFHELLRNGSLTGEISDNKKIRVQWDPERTPRLEKIENLRSIQVGIAKEWVERWVGEMILGIEDVTLRARELKETLDREPDVSDEELIKRGLLPEERLYELPQDLKEAVQRRSQRSKKE